MHWGNLSSALTRLSIVRTNAAVLPVPLWLWAIMFCGLQRAQFIVRIFRSVSGFEFYTVQAKLCPIFCIAGIEGKSQGDCRRAEIIALVNRYLGEYRYFLRKKSAVRPDFGKSLTDRKILTII